MNTQTNTQTYTVEEVATMLLALSGRVDTIEAQLSKKSLKKTAKPKRSVEEIEAEKLRKAAAKQEKAKLAEEKRLAKEAKKLVDEKAKAEKKLKAEKAKAEKKLKAEKLKAEKKLKAEEAKAEKKLKAEKLKAEKLAAKQAKKAAKGQSFDKSYTKKRLNLYRDLKAGDEENNQFKGINGKFLRIARKKDGSDTKVHRVNPENWTEEATKHFDSLEDKWDKKSLPFSPDYVAPEPKIKSAKKKVPKKKKAAKKTLVEQTAVVDTDDELEEEIPSEYAVYRRFQLNETSSDTTWLQYHSGMMQKAASKGYVAMDEWAWKRDICDEPFNDKTYDENPLKPKVGKNILKEGKIIGNCVESFNPVTEDGKDADTIGQVDDEIDEIEDEVDELIPDALEDFEYDSDGYREFSHPSHFDTVLKISRDGRVCKCDEQNTFLGFYNEETMAIVDSDGSASEDDAFEGENDMVDIAVF